MLSATLGGKTGRMAKSGLLERLGQSALDLVFPPRCVGCAADGSFLCDACSASLQPATGPRCLRCWRSGVERQTCVVCQLDPPAHDGLRAAYVYDGLARELVHALKYRGLTAVAASLSALCAQAVTREQLSFDVVVPVPLHRMRKRMRGYNQAELLARGIASELGLPVATRGLERTRGTDPQAKAASADERWANVEGAFRTKGRRSEGRRILLVDDVTTSGATLASCASALKEGGASVVLAFAFARAD
jgi:ComF family protein